MIYVWLKDIHLYLIDKKAAVAFLKCQSTSRYSVAAGESSEIFHLVYI